MKIRVPATTANLGCGYDTFGMALGYYNYIECELAERPSLKIVGRDTRYLPQDGNNLVMRSAQAVFDLAGRGQANLAIVSHSNIPLSRGMGSSSSAIVGGVFGANELLGRPLDQAALLELATQLEGHPDNVAPALLGGFTIIAEEGRQHVRKLAIPSQLRAVLAVPNFHVSTKKARAILPQQVPLADAIYNLSHAAMLAVALAEGDLAGFGAMLGDRLHQPYRFRLVKGAEDVIAAAQEAGALGSVLSGSGPTIIAFTAGDEAVMERIGRAMAAAFKTHGVQSRIIKVEMDNLGTQIEEA